MFQKMSHGSNLIPEPFNATNPEIVYTSSDTDVARVEAVSSNNRQCIVSGISEGTATITATAGNVSTTFTINVTANE